MNDEDKILTFLRSTESFIDRDNLRAYFVMGYFEHNKGDASVPELSEAIAKGIADLAYDLDMPITSRIKGVRKAVNLLVKKYGMLYRDENDRFHLTEAGRKYVERYPSGHGSLYKQQTKGKENVEI